MKAYGEVNVQINASLTSAVVGDEWSASRTSRFTPGERAPGTHWIGGWVGPRTSLDDAEKWKFLTLQGLEHRPFRRPAHSQLLYRLCYLSLLLYEKDILLYTNITNNCIIIYPLHIAGNTDCNTTSTFLQTAQITRASTTINNYQNL
jgi:hypothetical protein